MKHRLQNIVSTLLQHRYHLLIMLGLLITTSCLLYIYQIQTPWKRLHHAQQQINQQTLQLSHAKSTLTQCKISALQLNNRQSILKHYLQHQLHSPQLNTDTKAIELFFAAHRLTLEHYTPIENTADHQHTVVYRYCGSYSNMIEALNDWNRQQFYAWITKLLIEPCPHTDHLQQLTLSLETAYEQSSTP